MFVAIRKKFNLFWEVNPELKSPRIRFSFGVDRHLCMDDASAGTHPLNASLV